MRTTLVLEVNDDLVEFVQNQHGLIDPSALVNKVLHEEKARRQGNAAADRQVTQHDRDGMKQALEEYLDQQTPAAD